MKAFLFSLFVGLKGEDWTETDWGYKWMKSRLRSQQQLSKAMAPNKMQKKCEANLKTVFIPFGIKIGKTEKNQRIIAPAYFSNSILRNYDSTSNRQRWKSNTNEKALPRSCAIFSITSARTLGKTRRKFLSIFRCYTLRTYYYESSTYFYCW